MSKANDLTHQIIKHIFEWGGFAWRSNTVGIFDPTRKIYRTAAKKGVSDVIGVIRGRFLAVEVKIGKDRLSPEQEGFILSVRHAGGNAFVVHTFDEFKREWDNIKKDTEDNHASP